MPIRPFTQEPLFDSKDLQDDTVSARAGALVAHIDGGARGNPGPAGYGVAIQDGAGRPVAELSEYLGKQTNNYAEYSGLLGALAPATVTMAITLVAAVQPQLQGILLTAETMVFFIAAMILIPRMKGTSA